jgi:Protein of unknown function (DUF2510)
LAGSGLASALTSRAHQRHLQTVNRLLPEPAAVAVPVQVDGATWWSVVAFAGVTIAVIWSMASFGKHSPLISLVATTGPPLIPMLGWLSNLLLASRTRPLRLPWGAVLAASPSTVALVSISPWSWMISRGGTVKASWPRHHVVVEVAPRRRFGVRKVTLRTLDGTTIRLQAVVTARWVDPVLTDLAQLAATGVGQASVATSDWYSNPVGAGLRYWDGQHWTPHVSVNPWAPPRV